MAAADFEKEIRRAVDTGRVEFGYRNAEKNVLLGRGKLLVLASSIPAAKKERLVHAASLSGIPVYGFSKNALRLGGVCGKPFPAMAIVVMEQGKSKILALVSKGKTQKKQ